MSARSLPPLALALGLAWATTASALPPTAARALLPEARTPEELRQRLGDLARDLRGTNPVVAAEAAYFVGLSWSEEAQRDSASAWWGRAVALRGSSLERLALADLWLASGDPGDARRTVELLRPTVGTLEVGSGRQQASALARLGWAYYLAGHADSALPLLRASALQVKADEWVIRLAEVQYANGDDRDAVDELLGLLAHTALMDPRAARVLDQAATRAGVRSAVETEVAQRLAALQQQEDEVMRAWGAEAAGWSGPDGFRVSGHYLRRLAPKGRAPGVLILRDFTAPLAAYDSLALLLNHQGYPVLLMEPRGVGHSRDTTLCAPYAWSGREAELRSLCAADAQRGLDALAQQPSVDSTALVVVGLRESAPIATLAAASDPRVKALVLVTPRPGPTELGTMRATVERLRCPVLFQTAPEEFDYDDYIETLNRSLDPQTSRIVSCQRGGSGAALYQHDDRLRAQLRDWLKEILAPRRPAARRR